VPLAQVVRLGVALDVVPRRLNLSADLQYQLWSTFKSLDVRFLNADGTETVSASPRDSQDSLVFNVGGEVRIIEGFAVRAGYAYDEHTLPEATVNPAPPDSNKHVLAVGASYDFRHFGINAHFSNVFFAPRTALRSDFPGTWTGAHAGGTMAYTFGLSVTANLDVGLAFGNSLAPRSELSLQASR
jgi:long-subunit fatty acid transport protein